MRISSLLLVIGLSIGSAAPSRAWDAGGHMISAQIAYDRLSPAVKTRVDNLVPMVPDLRAGRANRAYDFASLAAWMDDVRGSKKREAYSSWHYINVACGGDPRSVGAQNALDALEMARVVLRSADATDKQKAEWLAIALHLIGDLHQPLHCTDRDLGGNSFPIAGVPGLEKRMTRDLKPAERGKPAIYQRLHALWDSGYRYDVVRTGTRGEVKVLYDIGTSSKPDTEKLLSVSRAISAQFLPTDTALQNQIDAEFWIRESSQIACDWSFATPPRRTPAQKYFERLHDTSCTRLALAGSRMAAWLEAALSNSN